jgi:hypothetical protein
VGYEVIYSYHERIDGVYNKDETKTLKKKVGDPFEEIHLEKLASTIMGQLARRDIFVVGVEVFELAKKKISFRETDNGVVIKNKKFSFDKTTGDFSVQDIPDPSQVENHVQIQQTNQKFVYPHEQMAINKQSGSPSRRAIDTMVFSPELPMIHEVKTKGFKLTVDKKYQVFSRKSSVTGEILSIVDDQDREIQISDKYFIPANVSLIADKELNFSEKSKDRDGGNLFWGNASSDNVPIIRK